MRYQLEDGDKRHGTVNGYINYGCRCSACTKANSDYLVPRARERRANGLEPNDRRHGTDNGYTNYGCRCSRCTVARAERVYFQRTGQTRSPADTRDIHAMDTVPLFSDSNQETTAQL